MSNIRRQSIISSLVIYIGFAVGLLNTYFFTKEGFLHNQYGLTGIFIAIATMMMAFANLAMPSYIFKFYHYYNDHLPPRKNDMLTWALMVSIIGFVLVIIAGLVFKDLVIRKFGEHSPLVVKILLLDISNGFWPHNLYRIGSIYMESWQICTDKFFKRSTMAVYLPPILLLLLIAGIIKDFNLFIKLYAFTYPGIAVILFLYLVFTKKIHFTFKISKVSRRYFKKIRSFCLFVYAGAIIFTLSQVFDSIVIASVLRWT